MFARSCSLEFKRLNLNLNLNLNFVIYTVGETIKADYIECPTCYGPVDACRYCGNKSCPLFSKPIDKDLYSVSEEDSVAAQDAHAKGMAFRKSMPQLDSFQSVHDQQ